VPNCSSLPHPTVRRRALGKSFFLIDLNPF